jgi:type I restriction enzyme S subunit
MTLTMTTIRQPDLELAPIIYPSLDEQERILLIITSIDNQIEELESKKTSLEKIKKWLMQKLLTGQIRVKV